MPETVRQLIPPLSEPDSCGKFACVWEKYLWRLQDAGILDATVYRECPECGGIENHEGDCNACGTTGEVDGKECPNCEGTGRGPWVPCPACKDAPTAIVSAALREKAIETIAHTCEDVFEARTDHTSVREALEAGLDAVLSTVLGRPVRYAKEVGRIELLPGDEPVVCLMPMTPPTAAGTAPRIESGDPIAILEKAGKEKVLVPRNGPPVCVKGHIEGKTRFDRRFVPDIEVKEAGKEE